MNSQSRVSTLTLCSLALTALTWASPSHASAFDSLKQAADKATEVANKSAGVTNKASTPAPTQAPGTTDAPTGEGAAAAPAKGGSGGSASSVSTKFDYVPGDKVLFLDDFTQDELGEFPARWRLMIGTFEVAEMNGERWLRCTAKDGTIAMKLPAMAKLPEFWTLEFDFYATEPMASALTVRGVNERGNTAWEAIYPQARDLAFRSGDMFSTTTLEGVSTPAGRHHVMFMARGPALKVYMDLQRMANAPDISAAAGMPGQLEIRLWAPTGPMITNVRFAEGNRPAQDLLESGKFVTHGIHFNTGSDAVLPESAPVLRQVTAYMQAHPDVKLRITGYTDNIGSAASNLDLSKRRASSVAAVLSQQFGVSADRFATDGMGDAQPVGSNATPEGRAMNRRVEFEKL